MKLSQASPRNHSSKPPRSRACSACLALALMFGLTACISERKLYTDSNGRQVERVVRKPDKQIIESLFEIAKEALEQANARHRTN